MGQARLGAIGPDSFWHAEQELKQHKHKYEESSHTANTRGGPYTLKGCTLSMDSTLEEYWGNSVPPQEAKVGIRMLMSIPRGTYRR